MSIKKLHTQVLLAMVVGCILGLMFKNFDSNIFFLFKLITMLGTMFISLLKMVMIPLIFTSVMIGVSSIKSGKRVSQIGFKTFMYYLGTSLCAIIIGLSVSNIFKPGQRNLATCSDTPGAISEKIEFSKDSTNGEDGMWIPSNQSCDSADGWEAPYYRVFCDFEDGNLSDPVLIVSNGEVLHESADEACSTVHSKYSPIIQKNYNFDPNKLQTNTKLSDILIRMIPTNPIKALASGDMLGIIFFAIFFGLTINMVEKEHGNRLRELINAIFKVTMKITELIIKCAPIGVCGLMANTIYSSGFDIFINLAKYMFTIVLGLSIHLLVVLPIILLLFVKVNPIVHFKAMASAMLTAFSTSSSSATLPVTMKCVKENVKASNEVSSFVLPLGSTVNMDGTALYECAGVIFISQVLGVDLTFNQQLVIVVTALMASIGAAGIPSAGLVMIFVVTSAVGLTDPQVGIIIGAMLAIDRPLDMLRTMINVTSDSIGTAVIAKSEGEDLY